jgi:HlyD family secretion protein
MSRRVGLLLGLLAVVGIGGGWVAFGARFSGHKSAFHLEKSRVERGDVVGRVTATGALSALVTVQVGSQVSGRISNLYADFGQRVKRGQVIARLDPQLFQAAMEQARANRDAAAGALREAITKADNAKRQLARSEELKSKNLIAAADFDAADLQAASTAAAVDTARGDLEQARANLHQATVNLGYATIISPINGVVISRNVDVGQTVAASLQAPTLYTIAEDLGKMQVHAAVSEADVGRLAPQMPASFVVDAYPDERFKGVIRQIRDAPQTLQNVVTYDAVIDVDNPDHRLKPGMTANVTFVYAAHKGVLRIPSAALRFLPPAELLAEQGLAAPPKKHKKDKPKDHPVALAGTGTGAAASPRAGGKAQGGGDDASEGPGSRRTVWTLRNERLAAVPIEVGVADGSNVEVKSGELAEGDVIVTDALDKNERAEAKANKSKGGLF